MKSSLIWAAIVLAGAIGVAAYLHADTLKAELSGMFGSAAGSTFSTAKIASINVAPLTAAATSTSILNTDASARWIRNFDVFCTGSGNSYTFPNTNATGLGNLSIQAATTSVSGIGLAGSTSFSLNSMNIATTTGFAMSASTTIASGVSVGTSQYYWPANTYLTFLFNATSTLNCTLSASYLAS